MWCGAWVYEGFRRILEADGFICHTPALRHHDVSPSAPPHPDLGTTSLQDYAADLEEVIRGLDDTPVLVGHSMGGVLAQVLAARGLARAMVLLAPGPPSRVFALRRTSFWAFLPTLMRWGFWRRPHRPSPGRARYGLFSHVPPGEWEASYARLVHEAGRAAAQIGFPHFDSTGGADVDPTLVTCPTLVLAGNGDRLTPPGMVRSVARLYEDVGTFVLLENHGHWLVGEPGWEAVAERVSAWIRELG
jgi:pimeloyl-ACP methyl ester carboxylesterase